MSNPVIVVGYDPNWPGFFETLRRRIGEALGDVAAAIEHIGRTAVQNLAARPIIDIDVFLASETSLPVAIERLASLGYAHQGNLGSPSARLSWHSRTIPHITSTSVHHAARSFDGTSRSEITCALTQTTPRPTAT